MSPKRPKRRLRGVVDTSVLVAGIAGFRKPDAAKTPSAIFLRNWIEHDSFTWLVTDDILDEYTEVLARLNVPRAVIGRVVNLLREEAEVVVPGRSSSAAPDPDDAPFWDCAEAGVADFIVTLNPKDFPQKLLSARVIEPHRPLPSFRTRRPPARSRR